MDTGISALRLIIDLKMFSLGEKLEIITFYIIKYYKYLQPSKIITYNKSL